jgi:magnesium-transporting ATPase (P-type)
MNTNTQKQSNKMRKRASKWNKRQLSLRQRISKIVPLNAVLVITSFCVGYIVSKIMALTIFWFALCIFKSSLIIFLLRCCCLVGDKKPYFLL